MQLMMKLSGGEGDLLKIVEELEQLEMEYSL